ncbi:hypothetical protein DBV14_02160 [Variovorax sp. KBW07]|nr:hypothetical protein DBV14_02160 [Variovorax sp. KBW07]
MCHVGSCCPGLGLTGSLWTGSTPLGLALCGYRVRLGSCAAPFLRLFLTTLSSILGTIASGHLFDELIDPGRLYICNGQVEERKRQENASHQPTSFLTVPT